ncbi:hypothetical protein KI387_034124, partial [Taxus chinensis]
MQGKNRDKKTKLRLVSEKTKREKEEQHHEEAWWIKNFVSKVAFSALYASITTDK